MKDKLKKVLDHIIKFLKDYKETLLLNLAIFILTVFIQSRYVYNIKFYLTYILMLLYIVIPTILVTLKFNIKKFHLLVSVIELYLLFLIFLDYCTLYDLYGITSSTIDSLPAPVEAIFVVFIFATIENITITVVKGIKNKGKREKKSEE